MTDIEARPIVRDSHEGREMEFSNASFDRRVVDQHNDRGFVRGAED
jgi:hypothetical protein